ncbi:MAG TPA: hypothetical protein VFQ53_34305 [Kofleriaceae bacterium]|nr:hypothetical protein [Kofleriaceae bacterium]
MSNDQKNQSQKSEPKTEMPKIDLTNPFASFDPFTYWTASQQAFHKAMQDAYGRAQSFADQYAALEQQAVARAQSAVATWAQMTQDAIAYAAQLSAEARKLGFETARKMAVGA